MTTPATRVLLVDDEPALQRTLEPLLRSRGYDVTVAGTAAAALDAFAATPPHLIILDLGLPDLDGIELCRRFRQQSPAPIIVLSARGHEADKVAALDQGADDYVTKPFGPEELLARLRVALRRLAQEPPQSSGQIRRGGLTIDFDRRRVLRDQQEIRLTPKEFELLAFLVQHPDRVLTHHTLLKAIWGANAVDQPEHLWVLVGQLRKKVEPDPSRPRLIVSEPWVGYRFVTGESVP
ncbi:MAG TPA: response regulator transcription factor [Vicinamibacterales bacterium]|nr:response regulator transcription factor [Vicinamibacterales bacterium]